MSDCASIIISIKCYIQEVLKMYIDISDIDFSSLRNDLIKYFGTAASYMPFAMADVVRVQSASERELIRLAEESGFDLGKYIK